MSLFPTCEEASLLTIQHEMHALGLVGRVRLRWHMAICGVCKVFGYQMEIITKGAQVCECGTEMSPECQARLNERLRQEMNNEGV